MVVVEITKLKLREMILLFFKAMQPVRQGLDLDLFSSRARDLFTTSCCLSNILTVIPQMSANEGGP